MITIIVKLIIDNETYGDISRIKIFGTGSVECHFSDGSWHCVLKIYNILCCPISEFQLKANRECDATQGSVFGTLARKRIKDTSILNCYYNLAKLL